MRSVAACHQLLLLLSVLPCVLADVTSVLPPDVQPAPLYPLQPDTVVAPHWPTAARSEGWWCSLASRWSLLLSHSRQAGVLEPAPLLSRSLSL